MLICIAVLAGAMGGVGVILLARLIHRWRH